MHDPCMFVPLDTSMRARAASLLLGIALQTLPSLAYVVLAVLDVSLCLLARWAYQAYIPWALANHRDGKSTIASAIWVFS